MFSFPRFACCVVVGLGLVCSLSALQAEDPPSAVGPLMKLFQGGRLPADRQGTVAEMICNRGNEHDLRVIFERVVRPDGFTPELRLKAMGWLVDAATTRKMKPMGDLSAIEQLVSADAPAKNPVLQLAAIKLASTWKVPAITDELQHLATDPKTDPALQRAAIDGLIAIGDPASVETIRKLAGPEQPLAVRLQAITGLVTTDLPAAAALAADALASSSAKDDPKAVLNGFLNRKDGTEQLAAALAQKTPKVDVAKQLLRYMYSVGRSDGALSDVLSKAAGISTDPTPPTPEEIAKLVAEVTAKGNAARGEQIFRKADVSCMKCHSVTRAGGQVGPELSAVGGSSPVDYVVNSILNPNLAVKEQYATKVFVLTNGMVLTGVIIDRDEVKVRIRDAVGQTITVPTADIEEEVEGKSLMPQGLTKFLTHDELLDLAKFVSELGKPGAYEIPKVPTIQRWKLLQNPPQELTAEVPHLEHIRQFVLGSAPSDWISVYGRVAGVLPLHEIRKEHTPVVLILQGELEVTAEGKVAVNVISTEKTHVWIDAEAFETQNKFEVSLTPGRHKITVRVEVSDRDAPELKVELTKPEDSAVQFDVVGGA
ncbi:MAG: HEAT repeat domain-containing protein [Planctomycetota bacterium]